MRTLGEFLDVAIDVLTANRVPFMLTGSLASSHYGAPRTTQDVDFVVDLDLKRAEDTVRRFLESGFYVSREAAIDAVRTRGMFNVIDPSSGWKLDLILRKDRPFSRSEFERRRPARVLDTGASLVSPEDLIVAKLEWARKADSDIQRRDVLAVLSVQDDRLDMDYLEYWIAELGLDAEWKRVCEAAGLRDASDPETE